MTGEIECPYCEEEMDVGLDYMPDEDEYVEFDCPHCSHKFIGTMYVSYTFTGYKADCLNGGTHKYEPIIGSPVEYFKDMYRCKDCGKEVKRIEEQPK